MSKRYDFSELSILVIDDNTYMRSIVKSLLKGFDVGSIYESADAETAFEIFQNAQIDLIIVDYALEAMDGVEFVKLVRTADDSANPYVPIIMLSAHTQRTRVEQARDVGITEFLRKPISAEALYLRIVQIIEHPRSFIKAKEYFGPDRRRRRDDTGYSGEERRKNRAPADGEGDEVTPIEEQEAVSAS